MDIKEFFSPKQIYIGTFIGGPLAAAYYLSENFKLMEKVSLSTSCKILGTIFTMLIFGISFQLPDNFPNIIIPAAYSAISAGIAWHWQVTKEEAQAVESYGFQSNWKVAGISAVSLIITVASLLAVIMLLPGE